MTTEQKYIDHLEKCFDKAERKESKLIQEVHDIPGMTGEKTRHFYNNLLNLKNVSYLEIGCWQGSSTCSALYGNKADVVAIDCFIEFGNPREEFLINLEKYKGENNVTFIDEDCFKVDISRFKKKFNIYLFDGNHDIIAQYKALDYYLPVMDDVFIFIADDANWAAVREGTGNAITDNSLEVLWKKEILLTNDNEFTHDQNVADKTWWNGIVVYLLKKK